MAFSWCALVKMQISKTCAKVSQLDNFCQEIWSPVSIRYIQAGYGVLSKFMSVELATKVPICYCIDQPNPASRISTFEKPYEKVYLSSWGLEYKK